MIAADARHIPIRRLTTELAQAQAQAINTSTSHQHGNQEENNMSNETSITIDGVVYVRADSVMVPTGDRVMVRSRDAGVFAGRLISRTGDEVELSDARRIWRWEGAATLSELAMRGTSKPSGCKFPSPVPLIVVLGVCEVIPMTSQAVASIAAVPVWSQT